jgi:Homing endonuclease associated repeat
VPPVSAQVCSLMPDKKQILSSIAAVARRLGHSPSRTEFHARSGISAYFVLRSFPSWSAAIRAAGLRPYRLNTKAGDRALLDDWGTAARKNKRILRRRGRIPRHIYLRDGNYNPLTLAKRFGSWTAVPVAFCKYAGKKREWADVVAVIQPALEERTAKAEEEHGSPSQKRGAVSPSGKVQYSALENRRSYGSPMEVPFFRHEPVNEQGVMVLFGMLAEELGYMIEAVQAGFPDCEAKRRVATGRWQRVQIEFEFESRNYRDHSHPLTGCDVIVCWRHNWDNCPDHIEVLELSKYINRESER